MVFYNFDVGFFTSVEAQPSDFMQALIRLASADKNNCRRVVYGAFIVFRIQIK
jgi:hypothetical protein